MNTTLHMMSRLLITFLLLIVLGPLTAQLSYAQLITQHSTVLMSDGVRLDATIVRPLGLPPSGGFPGVILIHGYGGNKESMSAIAQLLGLYGYATLAYSVRGQGNSEGVSGTMGPRELQDLFEMVSYFRGENNINREKIGVTGGSQGGVHSWMAAVYRMPGVKAVAPLLATPNFARDLVPQNCVSRWLVYEATLGSVRYDAERDRIRLFILQENHDSVLTFIDARNLAHLVDSIQIPVFQGGGWADVLFPANASIRARAKLASRGVPVWSYFGTNGHGETINTTEAEFLLNKVVQWFDHWLKGSSLPDADRPMVFYSDDRPDWPRHVVSEWPPQHSSTLRFYVAQNALSPAPPSSSTLLPFSVQYDTTYTPHMGWDDRYAGADYGAAFQSTPVRLVSPPLSQEIEVTGIPTARMFISGASRKYQAHVKIYDVSETSSGSDWRFMSRGTAGVRDNPSFSTRQIDYECTALSHIVPAGHRIGIEITSLDNRIDTEAMIVPYFASGSSLLSSGPSDLSYVDIPVVGGAVTDVTESASIAGSFVLHQNYPNPFNPTTTIRFSLQRNESVKLQVFDILGREVTRLIEGEVSSGTHTIVFNGVGLASGEYFYRLEAGGQHITKQMLLVK